MNRRKKRSPHRCQCDECHQHPHSRQAQHHRAINRVVATFDEKIRRRFVGLLAIQLGQGGVERTHKITGLSRTTIGVGRAEIRRTDRVQNIRRPRGGRLKVEKSDLRFWKF